MWAKQSHLQCTIDLISYFNFMEGNYETWNMERIFLEARRIAKIFWCGCWLVYFQEFKIEHKILKHRNADVTALLQSIWLQ